MQKIKVISGEERDWYIVEVNDKVDFEGHSIPVLYWVELLNELGMNANFVTITDEEMEVRS